MDIILANPRGFCAGVNRAIEIVERTLELFGAPIYVRHEVVHNKFVVDDLRKKGAVFVEELAEVPDASTLIFSAHGVSKSVSDEAERRGFNVFDATCPLVTKVHLEVVRHYRAGRECILIGHAGHPEVEGTMGRYDSSYQRNSNQNNKSSGDGINEAGRIYLVETPDDVEKLDVINPDDLAYVTQTTLSVDDTESIIQALRQRFPNICGPKKDDICYATQNRQDAVKDLAGQCDVILVVGSINSSNSNRLKEVAERHGTPAYLIDNAAEINQDWISGQNRVGVTAGASAPDVLVDQVVQQLKRWGGERVEEIYGSEENVIFPVPKVLQQRLNN